jgi:hypothetical protein
MLNGRTTTVLPLKKRRRRRRRRISRDLVSSLSNQILKMRVCRGQMQISF